MVLYAASYFNNPADGFESAWTSLASVISNSPGCLIQITILGLVRQDNKKVL